MLDHYPVAVFLHILGALGLFAALALEWAEVRSSARRIGALSMALLVVPGVMLSYRNFLGWPAVGLLGMAPMIAVGLLLSRRPSLARLSVEVRTSIALGVVAVMVFKPDLASSLTVLVAATLLGTGVFLIAHGSRSRGGKLRRGDVFSRHELETIAGEHVAVPDTARPVHLQFRRFAGCPVCNLHLRSILRRHGEIENAGIREVVVFHSSREELLKHAADLPFAVIADPSKELYREFGVEASVRALLDPRVWLPIAVGVTRSAARMVAGHGRAPSLTPAGGRLGLPADVLIASDGRVLAVKYGSHAYDQWSVDELLALARPRMEDARVGAIQNAAVEAPIS